MVVALDSSLWRWRRIRERIGAGRSPAKAHTKAEKPLNAYRLDFSVNEIEDGKKINTRQYSMNLNADDANEIKIGTRVPVESKQGEISIPRRRNQHLVQDWRARQRSAHVGAG